MNLPDKFQWLETIGTLPKLVSAAIQYLGVSEIKGSANNPVIMNMAKDIGVEKIYTSDDLLAWCAIFINHLLHITGKPIDLNPKDKYDLLRALKTAPLFDIVPYSEVRLGDVIKIKREGGGHVTLFIAKTNTGFFGIGGNQGNKVSFSEFSDSRVFEVRRYYKTGIPASAKKYHMDSTGKMSTNEI